MKSNWKKVAASLALLIGISGVAFGEDHDDHRGRDDRARVENRERDHYRDNRGWNRWNNGRDYDRRVYNNNWYGDRDHDRDHDRTVYNGRVYNYRPYNR